MLIVLHWVSVGCSFLLVFSLTFLVQEFTIGYLPIRLLQARTGNGVPIKSILFALTSLVLVLEFVTFKSPYN